MNELRIFSNPDFGKIRTMTIDGEAWFVGKDVADALGYANSRDAIGTHVDSEDKNSVVNYDGIPGNPNKTIINESGLYSLILSSQLPTAKKFKRWVTSEVLPSIRKSGTYNVPGYAPKASSVSEVVNLIAITRQTMQDQGCSANEVAQAVKQICEQFGIALPTCFIKPKETTLEDALDMIDYIYACPRGRGKPIPRYEDFIVHQTTVKLLGGKK